MPTPVDSLILALGRTRDPKALPALLRKLETLDESVTLSHHRALAIALEQIGDPGAAEPLARLLAKPGMRGHATKSVEPLHDEGMDGAAGLAPCAKSQWRGRCTTVAITMAWAQPSCVSTRMIFGVYLRGMREPFWLKPNRPVSSCEHWCSKDRSRSRFRNSFHLTRPA